MGDTSARSDLGKKLNLAFGQIVISDQTDVLPRGTDTATIAYLKPSEKPGEPTGSLALRGRSRIVLASLLLIGLIGIVWAVVNSRGTPKQNDVALNPKGEDRPAAKSPVGTKQKTVVDPEPSLNVALEMLTSSDWEWTKPENLGPAVNTAGPESSPHFSANGKHLWFQRGIDSKTDRAFIAERETPDKPWNPAQSIGSAIEFSGPMADMFLSRDEQTWMFVTWGPQGHSQQVFESTRPSPVANWSEPKLVAAASAPALFPVLSDDGRTLYITNSRDGDGLYALTRRTTSAAWSEPARLPDPPNANGGFRAVWNSVDGRVLVFHSARGTSDSAMHYDLWLTTRSSTSEPWQQPISFGPTINTTANERGACLSDDGRELIFASDRPGGLGATDLYVARRVPKQGLAAGPVLPPTLNPADFGLTIHDPQWKLIQVIRPEGRVFSTRFDREGGLYFAMPERTAEKPLSAPGIYRVQPDGTHQSIVQNGDWEFVFTPDEQRCFTHRGTMGVIAEVDLKTGLAIREVDMSPSDDGPTSPHFAPSWYRGTLIKPNEYLFADFGGQKRGPPSTGGIWKFGSDMAAPERLLTMPTGDSRVHALAFGRDQLFVAKVNGKSGSLATFDGKQLVERPCETLPSIGSLAFDTSDGSLLASELEGHQLLRIDLSKPDQPASVKPILSGFRKLNFGVLSLSPDQSRLAVVDFEASTIYVLIRTVLDIPAAPLKLELGAQLPAVTQATGLKLGDLDGDGDLDLFVARLSVPSMVLRNDGKGGFADRGQQLGDNASFAVALGDLDGDGDLDAFVCNSGDQENAIWLNDGRGTFQRSPQSFPPNTSNDVALADVDGDKDLDVVVSNFKGSVEIWINDGAGQFVNRQSISRLMNTGVALGDLDGDGDADLVLTCFGGDNRVWLNDGQGRFQDSEQSLALEKTSSVALGDLDRDGDLELFLTGNGGNRVWFNDGHGRFRASEQLLGDGECEAVELVDLDADHDLDAVTIGGGWNDAPRTVWINNGQGRFQKGPSLSPNNSQSLTAGDLDGDGDADIVFGNLNRQQRPAEVWFNQSNQSTIP